VNNDSCWKNPISVAADRQNRLAYEKDGVWERYRMLRDAKRRPNAKLLPDAGRHRRTPDAKCCHMLALSCHRPVD
jgi:hypothetical protein